MPNGAASKRRARRNTERPTVRAVSFIRKMSGGSQAHLLRGDDGRAYVVKFQNNPQLGRRALANEYVASLMFTHLGVRTPEAALIRVDGRFLEERQEVYLSGRDRASCRIAPGIHFGSVYPGDPVQHPIYEFLPDQVLMSVYNRADFFGALVLDKLLGNIDGRQTIFYRATVKRGRQLAPEWFVSMIDHGYVFGGDTWKFIDSDVQGIYARRIVYGTRPSIRDFEPWLDRLSSLTRETVEESFSRLPSEWMGDDRQAAEQLLRQVWRRRNRVAGLIQGSVGWLRQKPRLPSAEVAFQAEVDSRQVFRKHRAGEVIPQSDAALIRPSSVSFCSTEAA